MAVLYGYLNQADMAGTRVAEAGVEAIGMSVAQTVAMYNESMDALLDVFCTRATNPQGRFRTTGNARLQPLDNSGRALPVKPGVRYDVGWPLQNGGIAWGYDYITGEKLTVGDVAGATATMLDADARWIRDHILAAAFANTAWTFQDDEFGAIMVYGPANGDSTMYNFVSGAASAATDNHFLASLTLDEATFATLRTELTEHPENAGDVVAFVPTNLRAAIEALEMFYPVFGRDLTPGSGLTVLTGQLGTPVPGTVIGQVEGVWISEWSSLPSNYIVAVTTEGEPPLAMREEAEASLRGFKEVAQRDDHPWYAREWLRRAGFGAWNRVGAVVFQNAASYSVPAGYGSPMG